jgi:outer membrane protein insertion porin family
MAKYLSIFLISLLCLVFIFEPVALGASTFRLGSVSVNGNNRLSDEAIINYARLEPSATLSSEELNAAYTKVLDTGLFKTVAFRQDGKNLIITVEEYPTVNEISFEGNKKFTDEKLSSFFEN